MYILSFCTSKHYLCISVFFIFYYDILKYSSTAIPESSCQYYDIQELERNYNIVLAVMIFFSLFQVIFEKVVFQQEAYKIL